MSSAIGRASTRRGGKLQRHAETLHRVTRAGQVAELRGTGGGHHACQESADDEGYDVQSGADRSVSIAATIPRPWVS